jgi:hypothetical protein
MDLLHIGFILYYIFGILSIIGNMYVSISLIRIGLLSAPTKLVLYLHLTLVLENLATFPNLYSSVGPICEMIAVIRTYSGIANSFVVICLVLLYRYWFVEDSWKIVSFLSKYREFIIFGLPLISLLPLSTNSYGDSHSYFCTLQKESLQDRVWGVILYVSVIAVAITFSCLVMTHTVVHVFLTDSRYAKSLFRSVGFYVLFSILTWIPRALAQVGILSYLATFYLTYISGILYVMVFFYEKEYIKAYEKNTVLNAELQESGDRDSGYFSWDISNLSSLQSTKSLQQALTDRPGSNRISAVLRDSNSINISRNSMRKSIKLESFISGSNHSFSSTGNPIHGDRPSEQIESTRPSSIIEAKFSEEAKGVDNI